MITGLVSLATSLFTHLAAPCAGGSFLGFPKWYKYLNGYTAPEGTAGAGSSACIPQVQRLSDVWLIVAAIIELLLRIGGLVAIMMVIYGGVQYITSQGDPGKTSQARQTIINALVGLAIAIGATIMITFVSGRFNSTT